MTSASSAAKPQPSSSTAPNANGPRTNAVIMAAGHTGRKTHARIIGAQGTTAGRRHRPEGRCKKPSIRYGLMRWPYPPRARPIDCAA
ncbi:hypothetical protein [Ottowia testudinis]|uniref:Uncharacterized protein n=1 Tax=Ottowia testudinis TaxID=2816950 RepID=A0A975CLX0_9BURK|nr:hypothetical protein [Ottowia testudinis]QTD47516.1 hypothetical protein J1M35_00140 [Ottowia testudinis]